MKNILFSLFLFTTTYCSFAQTTITGSYKRKLINENFDPIEMTRKLKKSFAKSFIYKDYYGGGSTPYITTDLEMPFFENTSLTKLHYAIVDVTDNTGKSILRKEEESEFSRRLSPKWQDGSRRIRLSVVKGVKKEQLGKVKFKIYGKIPSKIKSYLLTEKDKPGTVFRGEGFEIKLTRRDSHFLATRFKGVQGHALQGYDHNGNPLAIKYGAVGPTSRNIKTYDVMSTARITAVLEYSKFSTLVELDLNKGEYTRSLFGKKPSTKVPVYYDRRVNEDLYVTLTPDDTMKAQWFESKHHKSVEVILPKKRFSYTVRPRIRFFGEKKPLSWEGLSASRVGRRRSVDIPKEIFPKVRQAFGEFNFDFVSRIKNLTIKKKADKDIIKTRIKRAKLEVSFNKNWLTLKTPKSYPVLAMVAYDKEGRPLKRMSYDDTSKGEKLYKYWGQPSKVRFQFATQRKKYSVKFDLNRGACDELALQKYKESFAKESEIIHSLRLLAESRKKIHHYGRDLAAMYYGFDKKRRQLKLIPQSLAHSNWQGVKTFGYRCKSYKGYYFSIAKGTIRNDHESPYEARGRERELKHQRGKRKFRSIPELAIIARPRDSSLPTYVINREGRIHRFNLNGDKIRFIPHYLRDAGWQEVL